MMLRSTPNLFALVVVVGSFFTICAIIWNWTFLGHSLDVVTSTSREVSGASGYGSSNRKFIAAIEPKIELGETLTNIKKIQNATLGFQKIYVLSMPTRTDKRDAIALSAYLTGLEVEFIDGVDPSTMSEKAYPLNWKVTKDEPAGTLGCWRGHVNIYRKMLSDNIQSAMILEDDVDWDVMIKAQMTEFARGTRYLQRAPASSLSPYGDIWDILSIGHCGMWNKIDEDQEYWVVHDDPTVTLPRQRTWWRTPNTSPPMISGDRTRLVLSPYHFSCLASYAISISGAARVIYDQVILPNADAIDMGIGRICRKHEYGSSTCLGTYPMIMGVHRQAGSITRDSDRTDKLHRPDRKHPQSDNLVYPVRLNLAPLLRGETIVKAQDPRFAMFEEIDIASLQLPRGIPVFVEREDYVREEKERIAANSDKIKPVDAA